MKSDTPTEGTLSAEKSYRDETWLHEQYVEQQKSQREVADECGVSQNTISTWLHKCDIDRETPGEDTYRDAEWLYNQYVNNNHSTYDIAEQGDFSASTVRYWLNKHGIETRRQSGDNTQSNPAKPPHQTYRDKTWLETEYIQKDRTTHEIADELNVHNSTIGRWANRYDLDTGRDTEYIASEAVTLDRQQP